MARTSKSRRKTNRRPARRARPAARKSARKSRKKTVRARRARKAKPARKASRKSTRRASARRPAKRVAPVRKPRTGDRTARSSSQEPARKPILNRIRRLLAEEERAGVAAGANQDERVRAEAVSGRSALRAELSRHTDGGPALTAGDIDAKWQDAYAVGDEAPGGDNPTPDQDRVDDIGKALGIEYQDNQELQGGEEVTKRDRHRWEYDPASSDDWPHDKK